MRILIVTLCILTSCSVAADSTNIEQITVTATRSNSQLNQLSSNLSAVDNQSIRSIQAEHINQVMNRVPGAWISRGNGQEHLTAIRSPVLTGAGGCGAFFMAQDGIAIRAPGFCNANQLFDINTEQSARIEVVRGPSSVLYGSNAVHGVVNVLTPEASSVAPLQLSLEKGQNDYYRAKVTAAKSFDNHSFAVLGNGTHDGGYKQQSGYDQQKLTVLHAFSNDQLSIKNVVALSNLNQETAGFIRGFDSFRDPQLKQLNPNPEAFRDNQSARLYSQITIHGGDGSSVTLTPYFRWASMTFLQHYLPWQATETNSQRSVGIQAQFQKEYERISLQTGFDLDLTRGKLNETQENDFSDTIPAGAHYDYQVDTQNYSPFATARWHVSSDLKLDAGLRFEKTRYDYDNQLASGSACEVGIGNCRFSRPADQVNEYDEWSFQLGFNYQITGQQFLYGKASNGYRAPQATELYRLQAGQEVTDLKAEVINAVELGWRANFTNVFVDLTLFDMQKDNFIFQDTERQNISNGSTEHTGIELQTRINLSRNWYAAMNATLAKHRYKSNLTLSRTAIRGNEIDTAPEHMASAQIGWLGDQGSSFEVEWVHQGNYFLDPQNTASYRGHNLLNLRAQYQATLNWRFGLRILNLTNVDYAERADYAFGDYRYFVGEPRTVYLTMGYQL
ncbi:TonB-dependent receptor [Aliiglaciecola litoralis]|uniref:TonB-dependent receptor n=1 Tax=Aliiglaciecola litoralis TaxID=582857 RepID=A0ABP3X272_9ALTE